MTLRLQGIDIFGGQSTAFTVLLTDSGGHAVTNTQVAIQTALEVVTPDTILPDGTSYGLTGSDGALSGSVRGLSGGQFAVTTVVIDPNSKLNGLSVTLTIVVHAPVAGSPTGGPTATATPVPCDDVQTIIVQTDTPNISSQAGGSAKITAVVFDSDNVGVARVNVLFDVQPRVGNFSQLVQTTDDQGTATTTLNIPPGTSFGTLVVSASACAKTGNVNVNIVSGVSTKPVASVVLQADPSTVGSQSGGTINLTAAIFDTDNAPINGIDVLFVSSVGKMNPLTDRTKVAGSQSGIASSVLQIPVGAIEQAYTIKAIAGGNSGSTIITVVPGRVPPGTINPGVPPGEPAGITLGASPTRLQVAGTGGTDLATVIGRVFDNNGNPLSGVRVHYHVVTAQSAPGAVVLPVTTPVPTGTPTATPTTLCPTDDPVSVSDVAGFAVIQVRSGPNPGPVTVTACTDTTINGVPSPLIEQQALVTVTSGPVSHITVVGNSRFIDNNDGSLLTTVSAIVTDAQGNTVEDGTPVFFEVLTQGANDPALNVAISSNSITNGSAPCDTSQFVAQTGLPISPQPGDAITCLKYPVHQQASEVRVRASVAGVVNNVNGQPVTLPGRIGDLEISVTPATVLVSNLADGLAVVQVQVFDFNLDPVENVRVRFAALTGSIDSPVLTDSNGEANATLTIPTGTASGNAVVRVSGGGAVISSITVPVVNTGGGTPTPGAGGQPSAMQFVGAQPGTIGVRGSGLPEQSTLTFQVTDGLGAGVSGVPVTFSIARLTDEQVTPSGVTDTDGNVQAILRSGERAGSIQVTAQVTSVSPPLIVRSTQVNILGGPPSQPNFSLAHQFRNVSGGVTFGLKDVVTAFVADRFGNPVPPGTAVNFSTKGGAIGDQTPTTGLGEATGTLISQAPVPDNGTVATLATTRGERPFIDNNGNGVCDAADTLLPVPEPFFDTNCNGVHDAGEDFIDLNGDGQFNADQGSGTPSCADQVVVFDSICSTFSAHTTARLIPIGSGPIQAGGSRDYTLIVSDNPDPIGNPGIGNPLVGGSTVTVSVDGTRGKVLGISTFAIPDAFTNDELVDGVNRFHFSVIDQAPAATQAETDAVVVTVTSDGLPAGGNGSVTLQDGLTFLAAPLPTSTITPPATVTPTPTPPPAPPAIVPTETTLSGGSGAPPNACTGGTQTFVVTGGSPPFTVFAGGGCVSTTSVPTSGGSFIFTAGNTLGSFAITVTDAAGKTASAGVVVLGPPTPTGTPTGAPTATPEPTPAPAHIQVALFINQAGDNGDGTLTSVISAVVTDVNGAFVNNGIPVDFSLVPAGSPPVIPAGVGVTGTGFTGAAQPCTLAFTVVAQPGDALSCVKYDKALQGTALTIRAQVDTPTGPISATQAIILPDLRPTATPTFSPTLANTPVFTNTPTPTPDLPAISPVQLNLFAGVSAAPNCDGDAQTFTVTGGRPPFSISGGGGCLSTTVVPTSGGSFSLVAGNAASSVPITVTDALGRTATANVSVQTSAGAFIKADLFVNNRNDNGDGTFTSILGALVTDINGVVVPDGVPVEFALMNAGPGVSVTSPGFTHAIQPCTVSFNVVPQPGDALSCIKYVQSLQGTTVTFIARVMTSSGIKQDVATVTLPDTRPTLTPTITPAVSATPTSLGGATNTPTSSRTQTATPTATPPAGSIQFISATPASIGVHGSGLPEQAVMTFRVNNIVGAPLPGVDVQFTLQGSGGETLSPLTATSDQNGLVSTSVASGEQADTVRVLATLISNPSIKAQSTAVSILGAPPEANHFSMAPALRNVAGRVSLGIGDDISVFANDRFGNAVPPGTSVSFVTNAASVVNPTATDSGGVAKATLKTEGIVPPTGVVTVMAFTHGEEAFLDNNGNGVFDAGDTILTDNLPEPFIDFRPLPPSDASCPIPPPSRFCNDLFDANTQFERFVDTNGNGLWDGGFLTSSAGQGTSGVWDNNILVFATTSVTFSGSLVTPQVTNPVSPFSFDIPNAGSLTFTLEVHDDLNNPIVGGSTISISSNAGTVSGGSITVPDGQSFNQIVSGLTKFTFVLSDADPSPMSIASPATVSVTVTSQNGSGTFIVASGIIH